MVNKNNISSLNALLKSVRLQIELLDASTKATPKDKELCRRLRKAKSEEAVILTKLSEMDVELI